MFESIAKFFRKFNKEEKMVNNSKEAAKERLHLVLMQDRANVSADFLELMKREIIEVIKKYIDVDENAIDVRLTNKDNGDGTTGAPALYANIPIMNIKNEARKVDSKKEDTKEEVKAEKKRVQEQENRKSEKRVQEQENRKKEKGKKVQEKKIEEKVSNENVQEQNKIENENVESNSAVQEQENSNQETVKKEDNQKEIVEKGKIYKKENTKEKVKSKN